MWWNPPLSGHFPAELHDTLILGRGKLPSCRCCCLGQWTLGGRGISVRGAVEDESEQLVFPPPAIEAADEFIPVPLKVLPVDPVKGAPGNS